MTLVIAHRGASRAEPENTIAAFERAAAMGADGVELDVRRTADDRLVVHHDAQLADGRLVRATRRTELPAHIPELVDALDACAGMFVNVEIKNIPGEPDHDPTDWIVDRVAIELERRGAGPRWLVSSFRFATVDRCRAALPGVRTAVLTMSASHGLIRRAAEAGHHAIHPWDAITDAAYVRAAHAVGVSVNVWTCNDEARMHELIGWGVDGICTDVPDAAAEVRRAGRALP